MLRLDPEASKSRAVLYMITSCNTRSVRPLVAPSLRVKKDREVPTWLWLKPGMEIDSTVLLVP